ncbi:MAG: hypothetical protein K2P81_05000 [Bacteriovoracaceae bacterium]|nr:hypothetical protein [Bacteriovoracaceae bacterium]
MKTLQLALLNSLPLVGAFFLLTGYSTLEYVKTYYFVFYALPFLVSCLLLCVGIEFLVNKALRHWESKNDELIFHKTQILRGVLNIGVFFAFIGLFVFLQTMTTYGRWTTGADKASNLLENLDDNKISKLELNLQKSLIISKEEMNDPKATKFVESLIHKIQKLKEMSRERVSN